MTLLVRVDPEKNANRWYSVSVQPTLLDCNLTHNVATAAQLCFQCSFSFMSILPDIGVTIL